MFRFDALTIFAALLAVKHVTCHGIVSGIVADGTYYEGYSPSFQYQQEPPTVVGWSSPQDINRGFIDPNNYITPEIICHLGAKPAGTYATVAAGGTVELQWSEWPVSHHGPVIDYLANCNGECTTVDKTTLRFNKISGVGLISYTAQPGIWASDQLISANNTWSVTIPSSVAPGNYVLRHEIIALHSAGNANGAQNYPQCVNLKITGSGTDNLGTSGTSGDKLYTPSDPGILVNIYTTLSSYAVPGPVSLVGAKLDPQHILSSASQAPTGPVLVVPTPSNAGIVMSTTSSTAILSDSTGCPSALVATISVSPVGPSVAAIPTGGNGTDANGLPPPPSPVETFSLPELYDWLGAILSGWFRLGKNISQRHSQHARDFHA
ncbi:hypothetical protein MMC30_006874 [Trapelia coarctata]|nr:hypothetical protein [Trapelia coarctata]